LNQQGVYIQGLLLAFACVVILMPPYLRLLHWLGMGKKIRRRAGFTSWKQVR
jgi:hypothetical protein